MYKRQLKWDGPYTVKKRINDVACQTQEGQLKFKLAHLDHLTKYYCRDGLPVWDEQASGGRSATKDNYMLLVINQTAPVGAAYSRRRHQQFLADYRIPLISYVVDMSFRK